MDALVLSNIVLWVIVVILSVVVFALMRQIGILHERVFPAGALMTQTGPKVGEPAPRIDVSTWANTTLSIGGATDNNTLLLFIAPNCPVCKTLLPIATSVAKAENKPLNVLFASDGPREEHLGFVNRENIPPENYILSETLGMAFLVDKLPYAVLIDQQGIIRSKGLVNSREHLESLFEAMDRGVASLQELLINEQA